MVSSLIVIPAFIVAITLGYLLARRFGDTSSLLGDVTQAGLAITVIVSALMLAFQGGTSFILGIAFIGVYSAVFFVNAWSAQQEFEDSALRRRING